MTAAWVVFHQLAAELPDFVEGIGFPWKLVLLSGVRKICVSLENFP